MSTNLTGDAAGVSFNPLSMWKKSRLIRPRDSPDKMSISEGEHISMLRDDVEVGKGKGNPLFPLLALC